MRISAHSCPPKTHPHGWHRRALAQSSTPQLSHAVGHARRLRPHIHQHCVLSLQFSAKHTDAGW